MNGEHSFAETVRDLPVLSADIALGECSLLIVAPHPDEEALGCGGLLSWASHRNRRIRILFLTDGEASHPGSLTHPPARLASVRRDEARAAAACLGLHEEQLAFLGLPDGALETLNAAQTQAALNRISGCALELAPALTLVTAWTDPHGDYQAAYRLVRRALETVRDAQLRTYPVWSWLLEAGQFGGRLKGCRVDVAAHSHIKRQAIQAHASQLGRVVHDSTIGTVLTEQLLSHANADYEVLLEPTL
jgi:LmbE family N-acetylglucosaminyl deacetylase